MTLLPLAPHKVPQIGQRTLIFHEGYTIVVFNVDGQVHAIKDECPHTGAALCTGRLSGHIIQCPAHGLRFDLRTGAMPSNSGLHIQVYPVREHNHVYVLELPRTLTGDQPSAHTHPE